MATTIFVLLVILLGLFGSSRAITCDANANKVANDANDACLCKPGFGSFDNGETCVACAEFTYSKTKSNDKCDSCNVATTEGCGGTSAGICKKAYGIPNGSENIGENCAGCTTGFYKDTTGNTACTACEDNKSACGGASAGVCQPGFSGKEKANVANIIECVACVDGKYKSDASNDACITCAPEAASNTAVKCQGSAPGVCQKGFGSTNNGVTCNKCQDGTYSDEISKEKCVTCEDKKLFCGDDNPGVCPAGYGAISSNGIYTCSFCASPTYQDEVGIYPCKPCLSLDGCGGYLPGKKSPGLYENINKKDGIPIWVTIVGSFGVMALIMLFGFILVKCIAAAMWRYRSDRVKIAIAKRCNKNDKFRLNNGYSWDYVLSFPIYEDDQEISSDQRLWNTKRILSQLSLGGLQIRLFYNSQHNRVYVKIRASQLRLMKEAARTNLVLQLDETALEEFCKKGRPELGWGPIMIPESSPMTSLPGFKYHAACYQLNEEGTATHETLMQLFKKWPLRQMALKEMVDSETVNPNPMHKKSIVQNSAEKLKRSITHYSTRADGDICKRLLSEDTEPDKSGYHLVRHESIFRAVDRLKLIKTIMDSKEQGGCCLQMQKLLEIGAIEDMVCMHDHVQLGELQEKWIKMFQFPWNQDTDAVKNYFGERIGLYFCWSAHYTTWLMFAALMGIIAWAFVIGHHNDPNSPVLPYFALIMSFWGTLFLESWKRTQQRTSSSWGMDNWHEEEAERPQFHGLKTRSAITGKEITYYPDNLRLKVLIRSYLIIFASTSFVVATLALTFLIGKAFSDSSVFGLYANELTAVLLALQIDALNYFFARIALWLNHGENHRTATDFENALISKTYAFQFLNSFGGLFYVGFMQPYLKADMCSPSLCFYELQATLGTLFITRLFVHNYYKLVKPLWKSNADVKAVESYKDEAKATDIVAAAAEDAEDDANTDRLTRNNRKAAEKQKDYQREVSEVELMFLSPEYDELMGTFNDYSNLVAQFGYMTMFVSAFPLITVLALVNNYIQMRVDAWHLCQIVQRPMPKSQETIGKWQSVLEITGVVSVFTNAGLLSFTSTFVQSYTWPFRIWVFFIICSVVLSIKNLVAWIIPDIPNEVKIQNEREDYITGKVVNNKRDVIDMKDAGNLRVRPNFRLKVGDDDPL